MTSSFDYHTAFSRNLGWLTEREQETLRQATVAIAGMGGVGGNYLLSLCRLGVGNFHIADFDQFEVANFNRQVGATINHLGADKAETMAALAKEINPEVNIKVFNQGVTNENVDEFLDGVDHYLDGLDFYCLDIREVVFAKVHEKKIPATTIAPIGMGASLANFLPGKMSFERFFGLSKARSNAEKAARFALGLIPTAMHREYLVDPTRLDFKNKKAPSTFMGCQLCAGVAGAEVAKIIIKRGVAYSVPHIFHFDAFLNRYERSYVWLGYRNPLQQLKIWMTKKYLNRQLG